MKGIEPSSDNAEHVAKQSFPPASQDPATQIRAQTLDASCLDLAKVVASWSKLPSPLKAAILAIIGANENQRNDDREALS